MKSFAILRTNVGLTTNVKVVVDSKYNLSLDSIDSLPDLKNIKYKNFKFTSKNYYDELVPYLWKKLPIDVAYHIKYDNDNDTMSNNFKDQYDELYNYGARNIIDNKNYSEEYEYFAPLYITNQLPSNFIIFRVDGIGLNNLDRYNFNDKIVKNLKTVKLYDLSIKTNLGQWLDINFVNNKWFPNNPLSVNFKRLEFSEWRGIDYKTGGYITKSLFLDDYLEKENEIFEFEKFVFDNYRDNGVIFPNILNLSFLYDDMPATENSLRRWSINRYYGFYVDKMDLVKTITPYENHKLKDGIKILENNIFSVPDGTSPFIDGFNEDLYYYVEYEGNFYKVVKFQTIEKDNLNSIKLSRNIFYEDITPTYVDKWKIISDIDLKDKELFLNKNSYKIDDNKRIVNNNGEYLSIDDFDVANVWLIEINGEYHNLIKDEVSIKLNTDWGFTFETKKYSYYINSGSIKYTVDIEPKIGENPKSFKIYRLDFSNIKDFDDKIVDTEYSKYEYEKDNEITKTDESKMYLKNLNTDSFEDFKYNGKNENIPVSSEYTANGEIFKIEGGDLTPLWRKNPIYCRWGYMNSLGSNDYPYMLNNSILFEKFNRSVNTNDDYLIRSERQLDYFYTINSSTHSYLHHSLHIENNTPIGLDNNLFFDFKTYLGEYEYISGTVSKKIDYDYFSEFFARKSVFLNGGYTKNSKKYSIFNSGDSDTPNQTLFRGIKFSIYDIENLRLTQIGDSIDLINTKNLNRYEDYKFSILLTSEDNGMDWTTIYNWEMDKEYKIGDLVVYDDVIYIATTGSMTTEPSHGDIKSSPYSLVVGGEIQNWDFYTDINSPYWNPSYNYNTSSIVWRHGEWWSYNENGNIDFWNPNKSMGITTNYSKGDVVIHKGLYYESLVDNNRQIPDYGGEFRTYGEWEEVSVEGELLTPVNKLGEKWNGWWKTIDKPIGLEPYWNKIDIWNPSITYDGDKVVYHNGIVYKSISKNNEDPSKSKNWIRLYSVIPDTNFVYNGNSNPYIILNSEIYKINSNPNSKTLENGIRIYVNKKWKNILINIYINDNTLTNLTNSDRDLLYNSIYRKLAAKNFIDSINNLSDKGDFTDITKYIIIETDGRYKEYNFNNIIELPLIIIADKADKLDIKANSLIKNAINIDLKANKFLNDNNIDNISKLDYYSGINIANEIKENLSELPVLPLYHGIRNIVKNRIFRFSGEYMPLFRDIELFKIDNTIDYNEIQILFYTEITDYFRFTFQLNGNITHIDYEITNNNYWEQIMDKIRNYYTGIDFIFQILDGDSKYINSNINNQGYSVLLVRTRKSYGDIKIEISRTIPNLEIDIQNSLDSNNIILSLGATGGHPPYSYSVGYVAGTYSYLPNTYDINTTRIIDKNEALDSDIEQIKFNILVRDSYGVTSSFGNYTLNSGDDEYQFDGEFLFNFI